MALEVEPLHLRQQHAPRLQRGRSQEAGTDEPFPARDGRGALVLVEAGAGPVGGAGEAGAGAAAVLTSSARRLVSSTVIPSQSRAISRPTSTAISPLLTYRTETIGTCQSWQGGPSLKRR